MNAYIKRQYFTMDECGIDISTLVPSVAEVTRLVDLLKLRYAENWVTYTDVLVNPWEDDPTADPDQAKIDLWEKRFKYIYETTSERYFTLIKLYNDNKNNLLDKISSITSNRFNDTPQNLGLGDTEDYTSTVSSTTTEVTPGELIDRLNNIHNKIKDIYNEWIREFDDLFSTAI